eukprot:4833612-Pyramimonas_sp.AAC.1
MGTVRILGTAALLGAPLLPTRSDHPLVFSQRSVLQCNVAVLDKESDCGSDGLGGCVDQFDHEGD